MKYLLFFIVSISAFALHVATVDTYSNSNCETGKLNLSQSEIIEEKEELVDKFQSAKGKMANLKLEVQNEMLKDKPNWEKINIINSEIDEYQNELDNLLQNLKKKIEIVEKCESEQKELKQ